MTPRAPDAARHRRLARGRIRASSGVANLSGAHIPRGFTLIEIGVVLVVVVLLMTIAMPTIRNVTGMQARKEVGKLAANLRAARGHAAVAGETCRMVITIAGKDATGKPIASGYSLECTKGTATVSKETSNNGLRSVPDKDDDSSMNDETVEQKKTRLALEKRLAFQPSKVLPNQTLGGRVEIISVWTPHQTEAYTQGQAYVYFFPSGTTEAANIILQDGDDYFTVQMTGLAGGVRILGDKANLPQQSDDDDDSSN